MDRCPCRLASQVGLAHRDSTRPNAARARPLARAVQEHIKKPLADELLFGGLTGGGLAIVDVVDGKLQVSVKAPPPKALPGKRQSALPAPQAD